MIEVADALATDMNGPISTPDITLNIAGTRLKKKLILIKKDLSKLLSKISFTK